MVALALAVVALALPSASASTQARLRIVDRDPLTLRGEHFGPRESVRVVVHLGTKEASRRARADAAGVFSARFAGFALDRCTDVRVTATGSRGRTASFTLHHPTSCGGEKV